MEIVEKIVEFDKYCETCKYKDVKEVEDPCNECLDNPTNINTKKPINYKEKDKNNKKGE